MVDAAYGAYSKNDPSKHDQNIQEVLGWTLECIAHNNLITIFDIRRYLNA
jgi:hypothetical protein